MRPRGREQLPGASPEDEDGLGDHRNGLIQDGARTGDQDAAADEPWLGTESSRE